MQNYISDSEVRNLAKEIMEGRCVLFLGAGISINAGFPSWRHLEKLMKEEASLKNDYGPIRTADVCKEHLGERRFYQFLENIFRRRTNFTALHKKLAELPFNVYITTNYDTLMEDAIKTVQGKENLEILYNNNPSKWRAVSFDKSVSWVLKIHGCITQFPDNIIIGEQDYLSYKEHNGHVIDAVTKLLENRSVLFIGYSLADWNITQILYNVIQNTAGYSSNRYFIGINTEPLLLKYFSKRFGLRFINIIAEQSNQTEQELLELFRQLAEQFEVPAWLIETIQSIGYNIHETKLSLETPLANIFAGFDSTIFIRLALKLEEKLGIRIALEKMVEPNLTIQNLVDLVNNSGKPIKP